MWRRLVLVLIGLALAVVAAPIFLRSEIEQFAERKLKNFLSEACKCDVAVGAVHIDYLPTSVHGRHFRLSDTSPDNGSHVELEQVSIGVNLRALLKKRILIEKVDGSGLAIHGTTEGTVVARLIEHFASGERREKEKSSWQVELNRLELDRSEIRTAVQGTALSITGISLDASRADEKIYALEASAAAICITTPAEKLPEITLGRLEATLEAGPGLVRLEALELIHVDKPSLEASASLIEGKLDGTIRHRIELAALGVDKFLRGVITGEAVLGGKSSHPVLYGHATAGAAGLTIMPERESALTLNQLEIAYKDALDETGPRVSILKWQAGGAPLTLSLREPIRISEGRISGALDLSLADTELSGINVSRLGASVELSGELASPIVRAEIQEAALRVNETPFEVSGTMMLRNILGAEPPSGETEFQLHSEHGKVDAVLELKNQTISVEARELQGLLLQAELSTGERTRSSVALTAHNLLLDDYIAQKACGELVARLEYSFPGYDIRSGTGTLAVKQFHIGCNEAEMRLAAPAAIQLDGLSASIAPSILRGRYGRVTLSGTASPEALDLSLNGQLRLQTVAALVPAVDEMRGRMSADIRVRGAPSSPDLDGAITLENGAFLISAARLDAEEGTVTAASIWNTGAIGAAIAYNSYETAVALSLLNAATLWLVTPIKNEMNHGAQEKRAPS